MVYIPDIIFAIMLCAVIAMQVGIWHNMRRKNAIDRDTAQRTYTLLTAWSENEDLNRPAKLEAITLQLFCRAMLKNDEIKGYAWTDDGLVISLAGHADRLLLQPVIHTKTKVIGYKVKLLGSHGTEFCLYFDEILGNYDGKITNAPSHLIKTDSTALLSAERAYYTWNKQLQYEAKQSFNTAATHALRDLISIAN